MTAQPERVARSELRRWCPNARTHQDEDDPVCGWDHDGRPSHRLRLRRMLVCSVCGQAYFTKEDFDGHECYSAY